MGAMEHPDVVLATATARQHGVISRAQALDQGLSGRQIAGRLAKGELRSLHPGVYHHAAAPLTPPARLLAAVLACAPVAVASHRSAAVLWGLREVACTRPEVTVPDEARRRRPGILVHSTDRLDLIDVTAHSAIPVTTVARTLLDLGAVVPATVVETAAQDAVIRALVTQGDLIGILERLGGPGRRGTTALRTVVTAETAPEKVESRLELALLRLIQSCGIPRPVLQHEVTLVDGRRARLDFAWPAHAIAVEADGRRWHATRTDFEQDLARGRAIAASGWAHYRFGWSDVHDRPSLVRAELQRLFRSAAA